MNTGKEETIGSWNERFKYTDEDIEAYLAFAEEEGYEHIILAGHSLGANKVIYYLSRHKDPRVEHFFLLSPANLSYMMSEVTEQEKKLIKTQVERGDGDPSEFLRNLNDHMPSAKKNELIFIARTGHTYQGKNQEVADDILGMLKKWHSR